MRKLALFAIVVLALSLCSVAADTPKLDIFGGYSLVHVNSGVSGVSGINTNGWDAQVTGNFNRYLGITGDISGQYKNDLFGSNASGKLYSFLFGPTLTYRNKSKLTPFAHGLFGVSHASASNVVSVSDNSFAMALGGGLDVKIAKVMSLRLGQFDYLRTSFADNSQNNFRYSAGVVFNLK